MLLTIATIIVALIAILLIAAAFRPNSFRVERSTTINASPEKIAPLIADFHQWLAWSPWEKIDPALQRTYSGSTAGKGAKYAWTGNNQVGVGSMEITDASSSLIKIKLAFLKPFECHNDVEFKLEPGTSGTNVSWAMSGRANYFSKLMTMFCSMEKMVGTQYEIGLRNLKSLAETNTTQAAKTA
jgi:hypothetical protein